eukprot:scaffold1341_cov178-Amphora_coffeaeformis.AAC.23
MVTSNAVAEHQPAQTTNTPQDQPPTTFTAVVPHENANDVSRCDSLITASLDRTREEEEQQQERNNDREDAYLDAEGKLEPVHLPYDVDRPDFQMGDHVYQWCSYWGIPSVFAHHGIVLDVIYQSEHKEWRLKVADFSNGVQDNHGENRDGDEWSNNPHPKKSLRSSSSLRNNNPPCIRTYVTKASLWRKVRYESNFWEKHFSRGGTATSAASDPPGMVRARVQFLLDDPSRLPPYDMVRSNCECVAVWCKTGTWATLQATSWLSAAAAGQVKSTATLVGAAASTQVSVPAAGLWGWMGYTTQVSLFSTQPWLLPALATYGAVTVGGPAIWLALARRHWKKLTQDLNTAFWEAAVEHPDLFVEYIMQWSTNTLSETNNKSVKELVPLEALEGESGSFSPCTTAASRKSTEVLLPGSVLCQLPTVAMEKLSILESHEEEKLRIVQQSGAQLACQEAAEC